MANRNWFASLSRTAQRAYLDKHPNSKYATSFKSVSAKDQKLASLRVPIKDAEKRSALERRSFKTKTNSLVQRIESLRSKLRSIRKNKSLPDRDKVRKDVKAQLDTAVNAFNRIKVDHDKKMVQIKQQLYQAQRALTMYKDSKRKNT